MIEHCTPQLAFVDNDRPGSPVRLNHTLLHTLRGPSFHQDPRLEARTRKGLASVYISVLNLRCFVSSPLQEGLDAVIVDTAGRLQIDERLMGELAAAKKAINPTDTLLVVDAMTGQEAATLVRAFNEAAPITGALFSGSCAICNLLSKDYSMRACTDGRHPRARLHENCFLETDTRFDVVEHRAVRRLSLRGCNIVSGQLRNVAAPISAPRSHLEHDAHVVQSLLPFCPHAGAILTKMDGDSRGGAALSVKEVSGRPIKFVGSGEKLEALEPFYPDRIASRILGMGKSYETLRRRYIRDLPVCVAETEVPSLQPLDDMWN